MLNVGQGNCCVWTSPQADIVIDANIPSSGNGTYVKGYLQNKALVRSPISLFMLTGWDCDHANAAGVGMVVNNFTVSTVWIPPWPNTTEAAKEVKRILKEDARWAKGYDVYHPRTDQQRCFQIGDTKITVFSPHPEDADTSNNTSIVAKLECGGFSVLITGDCEQSRWSSIVRYFGKELSSDVLVAPHHGSRNGITEEALQKIRPKLVLISAGNHSTWQHPHQEAVDLYKKYVGDYIFVTKEHGNIKTYRDVGGVIKYVCDNQVKVQDSLISLLAKPLL
ncbi:MAG: hypothetical protein FD167_2786 [bacterium]|nr:MAG: hypothetical protein FD167_2786 [bacterium]